jgi:hypothetical protein
MLRNEPRAGFEPAASSYERCALIQLSYRGTLSECSRAQRPHLRAAILGWHGRRSSSLGGLPMSHATVGTKLPIRPSCGYKTVSPPRRPSLRGRTGGDFLCGVVLVVGDGEVVAALEVVAPDVHPFDA